MKKTLNIAMIGYQFMGRAHANAWRQAAHFFQLPAKPVLKVICGRNAQAVKVAAEQLGFEESATDWKAVIDRDDIDIVDICTPGDSHCEIAIYAAQRGKAVLCEKPLANTIDEAQQMVTAAQDAGVTNMLCHNYRRVPAVQLAKQMIDNGELGTLHHYRGTYLQDWLVNPNVPRSWRLEKAKAGSGALGDIVSHNLDLARFLVGDISEVSGLMKTFVQERPLEDGSGMGRVDVDDAAMALLKFANGAIGSVEGSRFATGRKNSNSFEINGSKGSLVFDLERLNELQFYQEQGPDSGFRTIHVTNPEHPYTANWWPPGHSIGYEHSFVHTVVDFVQAVANGQSVSPDFADG
ncbi:MAG: Gfo/Idh/MocA family oxidoreductase, partial [Porticoccaceae bacterium]|nr:Gfo/Idh/MocA family oxidoreductase [Porticoccaceae bacterium]